jgi:hypothetical protein
MIRSRFLIALSIALVASACATPGGPEHPTPQQLQDAAHVIVRSATIWGQLGHATATPVVLAVNGERHYPANPRLQLDDFLYLEAGTYQLEIALVGSPVGRGLAQVEARTCVTLTAEARRSYVLRGVVEEANFRLDVLRKTGNHEDLVTSVPVSGAPGQAGTSAGLSECGGPGQRA